MIRSANPKIETPSPKEARTPKSEQGFENSEFGIRISDFTLWQLADSAFPTGGFAHSAGLEAAWQHGELRNRRDLISYVQASLHQLGRAALPFALAAHAEPERLGEFDELCDAFTTNHVANRASRTQGKAFLSAMQRIFGQRDVQVASALNGGGTVKRSEVRAPFGHFAPVFGACLRRLEIQCETTSRLFFFNHLRGVLAAAVRLNIVGPMEAQSIQHQLAPESERILKDCTSLALEDIAQVSPLMDIWQGAHDRLYSRLFQS
jgi:urease accessory protein